MRSKRRHASRSRPESTTTVRSCTLTRIRACILSRGRWSWSRSGRPGRC